MTPTQRQATILKMIQRNTEITREELASYLGVSVRTIASDLENMSELDDVK